MNTDTTQNVEKNGAKGSTKPLESRGSEENLNQGAVIGMVGGLLSSSMLRKNTGLLGQHFFDIILKSQVL